MVKAKVKKVSIATVPTGGLLTVNECAAKLRVSRWTLYGLVAQKKAPPHIRVGRVLRFDAGGLQRWIEEQSKTD